MKRILQLTGSLIFALTTIQGQTYLTENFDGTWSGTPAAPSGWTQTRIVLVGDGVPEGSNVDGEKDWQQNLNTAPTTWNITPSFGIFPTAAVSGSNVLFMEDSYFGSTTNAVGSRRMESPIVNLSSSTNPYARFFYFCGYSSTSLVLRVMASNDGGVTWSPIMFIAPNAQATTFASATPWQRINVKIPAAFKVANAKFALEMTNTWGTSNLFIDDFTIEEFIPATITSAGSGAWSNTATWVGGIVPTCDNDVIISTGHIVTLGDNITRCQNIDISGTVQYTATSTTQLFQVFGNMTINAGGTYFSGSGTTGKRSYFGGSIVNNGTMNFQPGTSATGALVWLGYTGNYSGAGTITNNRVPIVVHAAAGGVSYANTFTISNTCVLYLGTVDGTNLVLGNPVAAATAYLIEKSYGTMINTPTYNNTNVSQRNLTFSHPVNGQGGICLALPQVSVSPGTEIELISGNRHVTGVLTMNTHNNVLLAYPLSVGTSTGTQNITLTRGIIISSNANPLILNQSATGAVGIVPTTITSNGTNGGNHGAYVAGPVKINFPASGTTTRTFPLGSGTNVHTNLPSTNVLRNLVLATTGTAWNSQTITATIENAPSGSVNAPVNTVMGSRAYRLNMNGGPALPATASLTMRFTNSTFGGSDNLLGNLQDIRVVQSANLTGPWTERSLTNGTGVIANNTNYTRITTSVSPGPINNGDEYFAWGSTGNAVDMAATALTSPGTTGCYGANQTVSVQVTNAGIAVLDFSVNNATITSGVTGATTQPLPTIVLTSGTLAPSASMNVFITNTCNMTATGVYSFSANITTSGDIATVNDNMAIATRTVTAALPLPWTDNFNSVTGNVVPPGYTADNSSGFDFLVTNNLAEHGTGNPASRGLAANLYSGNSTSWVQSSKYGQIQPTTTFAFDYRIVDYSGYANPGGTATSLSAGDSIRVRISIDCGATYSTIGTIKMSNHVTANTFVTKTYSLSAYAGNNAIFRFDGNWGAGDWYIDIDNINLSTTFPDDVGASEIGTPALVGCYSANEPVNVTIKNYGLNAQTTIPATVTVAGPINQTLTGTYTGNLAPSATVNFNIGTINMTAAGVYSFNAITGLTGDNQPSNDAMTMVTRTVVAALPLPFFDNFNAVTGNTVPAGYSADNNSTFDFLVTNNLAEHGTGNPIATRGFGVNLWSSNNTSWLNLPKVGQVGPQTTFAFDYRIVDYSAYANPGGIATSLGTGDSIRVLISIDCGLTYSTIAVINSANHVTTNTFVTKTYSVGTYAGNDAIFRFEGFWGAGDYYFDLDNINICFGPPTGPVSSGTTICSGSSATLTTVATGTAQWYATSTPTSYIATGNSFTTPVLTSNTTYYLLDSTSCGLSTLTPITVTVNAMPSVTISAASLSVCSGNSTTLTAMGADTYSWSTNSTNTVIVVTLSSPTTYTLIGSTFACPDSYTTETIGIYPNPAVNITPTSASVCPGATVGLTAGGAQTYTWNTSATTPSIVDSPVTATVYSVTATSSLGCIGTQTVLIDMNPTPTLNISANNNSICIGASAVLTANGAMTYTWSTSATSSFVTVSPTVSTVYSVTGTSSLSCTGTQTINLTVNPKPTVSLTAASNTACLNGGSIALTGSPAGGVYSGANVSGNALNPTAMGTFNPIYSYTDAVTGCTNTASTSIIVSNCTGLQQLSANANTFMVYPNPNNGNFTVITDNTYTKEITIVDITGKIVSTASSDSNKIGIDIQQLANGVYYLKVSTVYGSEVVKLIKQ